MPVFKYLKEDQPALHVKRVQPEIVNDNHVLLLYLFYLFVIRAFGLCQFQLREQLGAVEIHDFVAVMARLKTKRRSDEAFTQARLSSNDDVFPLFYPAAIDQSQKHVFIK